MTDLTGSRLGNYDVNERLGAGGMAVVYRAVQQPLGREVALKALMPSLIEDRAFIQRFEIKLVPSKRRLTILLKAYVESLDEVRGEPANAWRQIDSNRFWTIHFQNPFAWVAAGPKRRATSGSAATRRCSAGRGSPTIGWSTRSSAGALLALPTACSPYDR